VKKIGKLRLITLINYIDVLFSMKKTNLTFLTIGMAAILSLMTVSSLATPASAEDDDDWDDKKKLICWTKDDKGDDDWDEDDKIKLKCKEKDNHDNGDD
jgi:hypothetical protein